MTFVCWLIFIMNSNTVQLMCLYIEPNYAITSQIQRQKDAFVVNEEWRWEERGE
jgi:hypothetical protein